VFGIGSALGEVVEAGNDLKNMENSIMETGAQEIELEIIGSSKRLRISRAVWEVGLDFEAALQQFRNQG
jgi:hypothetical protein